jgi:hypothetical protein
MLLIRTHYLRHFYFGSCWIVSTTSDFMAPLAI